MKKLIVTAVLLLFVKPAIPEDLRYENCRNCTIINGHRIENSEKFRRVYDRVKPLRGHHRAIQFAEALSEKKLWRELCAIAEVESGYDPKAVGKDGDSGAFQVMPYHGRVPTGVAEQSEQAERILRDLLSESRTRFEGVQRYNGSVKNPKTKLYASKVMRIVREI